MAYTQTNNQQPLSRIQQKKTSPRTTGFSAHKRQKTEEGPVFIPPPRENEIRTIVLGGVSEIGKNMYAIEYNDVIIVLECGTMFAESITPGVNTVMANSTYLKERRDKVRAIVITDAALTHTGAVPFVIRDLGNPTIYTRQLTSDIIKNRQQTFRRAPDVSIQEIEEQTTVTITDAVSMHFFGITEATPSTLGVVIETPSGCITYTGNLKLRNKDGVVSADEEELFSVFKDKKTVLSLSNSANAERAGFARSDEMIVKNVTEMIQQANHRVILPLFPSQVKRNCMILEGALKLGKKIYIQGQDMFANLTVGIDRGITSLPKEAIIPIQEMEDDDLNKVLIVLTGAENEEYESLEKISQGNGGDISIIDGDTVIFPSPLMKTNARSTQNLMDRLSRLNATIREYETSDVKASAHPSKDELSWIHRKINPTYFIPVKGYHYMLTAHTHILRSIGVAKESCVIPHNGSVIDISADGTYIKEQKQKLPDTPISVDGRQPSAIQRVVIQERKVLSEEGILIIIVFLDPKKLIVKKSPDIISRGFIYLRESQDLIARIRIITKQSVEKELQEIGKIDIVPLKKAVQKKLRNFLVGETNKQPLVVPIIFT